MDWNQMRARCSSARFCGVAVLRDHRLAFTRCSPKRGCGVADALPNIGSEVWGVVYEIDDQDVGSLDASEGYRPGRENNAYRRETRHVYLDGNQDKPMAAEIYFANAQDNPPLPGHAYKEQILSGAKHWHLPAYYIADVLEYIKVKD